MKRSTLARVDEALAAVGFTRKPVEPLPPEDSLSAARQALRHALAEKLGSTTGQKALEFIEKAIGRRMLVVGMTSAEIAVVQKALDGEQGGRGAR